MTLATLSQRKLSSAAQRQNKIKRPLGNEGFKEKPNVKKRGKQKGEIIMTQILLLFLQTFLRNKSCTRESKKEGSNFVFLSFLALKRSESKKEDDNSSNKIQNNIFGHEITEKPNCKN